MLLNLLGLPQDLLRWAGIAVLALLGVGLLVPRFEEVLERPFQRLTPKRAPGAGRGGFVLGLGLGAVYVPCAGPVLAAITVAGATGSVGPGTVVLTVSFALGAAIPLLILALAGRRVAERIAAFRTHQRGIRAAGGVLMVALALALAFNLTDAIQRALPGYTEQLQAKVAANETVREQLDLGGLVTDENRQLAECSNNSAELEDCGPAPAIRGIDTWLNTPDGAPVDLADLRGKVVLLDFWAYSCINCQRSVPHVTAWEEAYRDDGLVVIGVHTPEYAFERETRNVVDGAERLGITYPVAQDNSYATWTAYRNRYWPAHYLIDADGQIRQVSQGEGGYAQTETLIRELLTQADPGVTLPAPTQVDDTTPVADVTPETFLSVSKQAQRGRRVPRGRGRRTRSPRTSRRTRSRSAGRGPPTTRGRPRDRTRGCACATTPRSCRRSSAGRGRSTADGARRGRVGRGPGGAGGGRLAAGVRAGRRRFSTERHRRADCAGRSPGLLVHLRVSGDERGAPVADTPERVKRAYVRFWFR